MKNIATKYALSSRIIHWIMAVLIFLTFAIGFYMDEFLDDDAPNRYEIYDLHKSFGVIVFIFFIIRLFNRLIKTPPALPDSISSVDKKLAKIGHWSLYLLMFLTPLSGYLMSSFAGYPVNLFSWQIPNLVETNFEFAKFCSEAHEILAYSMIFLVAIHILAIFKHYFFDKNKTNILKRII
jgi:cytochrome b561